MRLAFDQTPWQQGWRPVRPGLWRNINTGETWRGWRQYGPGAGHYPGVEEARQRAMRARAAESRYAGQLRQVGTTIGNTIRGMFDPNDPQAAGETLTVLEDLINRYRDTLLRPWAERVVSRMLADVSRRDAAGWHSLGQEIGRALKADVESAPIEPEIRKLYDYQVQKILELPDEATERLRQSRAFSADIVRQMQGPAEEAAVAGRRWEGLVKDVRDAGLHVQSSANTVARTETGRAASTIQAVRAQHIGSSTFQWITANDADVRPLHREIAERDVGHGRGVYRYDDLPLLDDGQPGLPGGIWNCRCWIKPILPPLPV